MSDYVLDLCLSFVVGGAWVALASLAAQHFGGKVGGFIAGLPATAVLAIFFITYTEGPAHAYDLTGVFPLTASVVAVFLAAYAAFSRKSFAAGLGAGLVLWAVVQAVVFHGHPSAFAATMALATLLFVAGYFFLERLRIPDPGTQRVRHGILEIGIRAAAGGSAIVLAMLGSRFGGPVLGGILSAFPATILATLAITAYFGGTDLTRVMPQAMLVSSINCVVFAVAYRCLVLHMHLLAALAVSYGVSMVSAVCTFYWLNVRRRPASGPGTVDAD